MARVGTNKVSQFHSFTCNNLGTDEAEGGRKSQESSSNGNKVSRNKVPIPVGPNEGTGSTDLRVGEKKKPKTLSQLRQKERVLIHT